MCKTKFLQMCSFSIILTSFHSLNLSFPLPPYFISTDIHKFPPRFSTSPLDEVLLKVYVKEKHNLPEIINFFRNLYQFKKIYVTNFVQSQFWWIADCGFSGIRHIFMQNFVLVVYRVN